MGTDSGFDDEAFDEAVAECELIAQIDGAAEEIAFEVARGDVMGRVGPLGAVAAVPS
ncbi:hypothetical protein [Streptomyces sp.]